MTGVIDRLERDAYVVREKDPGDRRVVLVRLLPEGMRVAQICFTDMENRFTDFVAAIPPAERRGFVDTLRGALLTLLKQPIPVPSSLS
jgi:DNA-binding MarR family transcriptional regulator